MKWRSDRILRAPASALPVRERTWPSILTLGQPRFSLHPGAPEDDLSRNLGQMIGDPSFSLRWDAEPVWDELPPSPWRGYVADAPLADLIGHLGYGEIALTLRLLPPSEWRQRQPLIPADLGAALQAGGPLPQRLREAFAFALFEPNGPWRGDDDVLTGWTQAVRATLHQSRPLAQVLNPNSRWLALGYQLLDALSQLRARRPTLAEVEAGWQALQPPNDPALPHMFAEMYWGESAYRLLECGDTTAASTALDRQTAAAQALIAVLPDLADDLDGGLGRHHLGQLALRRRASVKTGGSRQTAVPGR
jgi:hypothetical protein